MFRAKTLLVLGAGASFEVGLPIGDTLLRQITDLIDFKFDFGRMISGDHTLLEALKIIMDEGHDVKKLNEHLKAGQQLRKSAQQALSIDNVIDALEDPKIEIMGKLGILCAILNAEANSRTFKPTRQYGEDIDIKNFSESWYSSLTKLLTENIKRSEVARIFENLEIVNFNYDRCLERYLPYSIAEYYGINHQEVERIVRDLRVHRPYGICGRLPWMRGEGPSVKFGQQSPNNLDKAAAQLRTFTEQIEEGEELRAIRAAVSSADRIIFLGFAFHRQNVRLLSAPIQDHAEIVATAYKISKSDQSVIKRELARAFDFLDERIFEQRIELADLTCDDFFRQYWRTLTAEAELD